MAFAGPRRGSEPGTVAYTHRARRRRRRAEEEEGMSIGTRNQVIAGCGAHHIALQSRDWEASLRLYRDVLGMIVVREWGAPGRRAALLDMGDGSHVELFEPRERTPKPGAPAPNDPLTHLALATTDTRAAIEQVRAAGHPVTTEPMDVDLNGLKATIAFFRGPSGESIEFFQTLA
jgi:catechol 2,3-dioxygenase-like lactoylglutathione lyase family enzyme